MTSLTTPDTPQTTATAKTTEAEVVVRCLQLTKVFRDFWLRNKAKAVDHIDLHVNRGEVFGLLGPNGSGKSTTIKMILGLLHPTSGRVTVFNKPPDDVATKRRIGYLPEESYLYRFLNARETLDYYARLFHLDRKQRATRIDRLLDMVGLQGAARRPVGEYSKGMQRRIGLAQALINDPDLLILDEPTTGLDPIGTRQIKDLILELSRRGKTIILCSHLLADVEDVCDRMTIMFGGKIRATGTAAQLLTRQDQTILQTPALDDATVQEIEAVLQRRGKAIQQVRQPRQKLEALFLEIVEKAQAEGATTSGASNAGVIADFLRTGGEAAAVGAGGAVIEQLVRSGDKPASALTRTASEPPPESPPSSPHDADVLNSLTSPRQPAVAPDWEDADQDVPEVDKTVLDGLITSTPTPTVRSPSSSPVVPVSSAVTPPAEGKPPTTMPAKEHDASDTNRGLTPLGSDEAADDDAQPSAEENEIIAQMGQSWKNDHPTPRDKPIPSKPAPPVKPATPQGEQPDSAFLDALTNTPPYEDDRGDTRP